jgi:hypothetical protein
MTQTEPRAWWADVEDLREQIEQRRAAAPEAAPAVEDRRVRPAAPAARRTVRITGHGAAAPTPRPLVATRVRTARGTDAFTRSPDRIAGWAALLGLVLVLVATVSH